MTKEEFLKRLEEDEEFSPGWQAIDDVFDNLYPGQKPAHFGTNMVNRAIFGGDEFLDGFSFYTSEKGYKHLVTYGMTVLYGDEEAFGGEWNGWGYEMTMKLKADNVEDCKWTVSLLSNLARYTYKTNNFFQPNQYVKCKNILAQLGVESDIMAFLLVEDTEARATESVYGKTEFIQLVGITESEFEAVLNDLDNIKVIIQRMKEDGNVDLVTDMRRTKSYL